MIESEQSLRRFAFLVYTHHVWSIGPRWAHKRSKGDDDDGHRVTISL